MGGISAKFGVIGDDLKHSWYFRLYALFWVVCVLTGFAAMIIFGGRAAEFSKENSWRVWLEKTNFVTYPVFQFTVMQDETATNKLGSFNCQRGPGMFMYTSACPGQPDTTKCVQLDGTSADAKPLQNDLTCKFNVSVPQDYTGDLVVSFSILDKDVTSFGVNQLFITPSNGALVEIMMATFKPLSGPTTNHWEKRLYYRSNAPTNIGNAYAFTIDIEVAAFDVFHYEQTDFYTGWMSAADIGGAAFFLLVIHTIVMGLIALCLENNSKFLKGASYTEIS